MGNLFGTDGVRGVANEFLSCELAMKIGRAAASVLSNGRRRLVFVCGTDTRISSDMLLSALMAGLCSVGADVINLGVVPTPAVAYLAGKYKADAGVMISASHNPAEYNGIKIFGKDGYKLPDMLEEQIENIVSSDEKMQLPTGGNVGKITVAANSVKDYCDYIKSTVSYSLEGLGVAVDCGNGAASATAAIIFDELGANTHILNASPDGNNINSGCGSTDMTGLSKYVKENKLDVGIAFDGDADRCLCVDEHGEVIDGDEIMAICAIDMKERGRLRKNTAVGTVMTNLGFQRFCRENGIDFIATKVGDRFVIERMLLEDAVFGGEQSGHVIFRDFSTTGDGQLTAVRLLSLMRRKNEKLSKLKTVMKKCPQTTINIKVGSEGKLRFYTDEVIKNALKTANEELGDDGRVVLRPSGTEPLVRVMVEGDDAEAIKRVATALAATVEKQLK